MQQHIILLSKLSVKPWENAFFNNTKLQLKTKVKLLTFYLYGKGKELYYYQA